MGLNYIDYLHSEPSIKNRIRGKRETFETGSLEQRASQRAAGQQEPSGAQAAVAQPQSAKSSVLGETEGRNSLCRSFFICSF